MLDSTGERGVWYTYDTNGNIIKIEHGLSDNKVTEFAATYDTLNRLVSVEDKTKYKYIYTYSGNNLYKVQDAVYYDKISEKGNITMQAAGKDTDVDGYMLGNYCTIEYNRSATHPATAVRTNTGRKEIHHFKSDDDLFYYDHT